MKEQTSPSCPSCKRELPEKSPAGLCPVCVLTGAQELSSAPGIPAIADIQSALPDLEIHEGIGRGGMGTVYRATIPKRGEKSLLKFSTLPYSATLTR